VDGRVAELLGMVPYSSSMTVALGYNAAALAHPPEGFGFLVPKKERKKLVACTWVGTKFSHRAPADKIVARCFLGGMEGASVLDESDESIVASVTAELREIAGVDARPLFSRIFRWPRSMAQYTVGHRARQSEVESRVCAIPGLHLAGNAYYGIGIPDCIKSGKAAAEKIAR
jgi:oxygen-dependent protoporphyrinogen oxidase